jgi:hypothetical protein
MGERGKQFYDEHLSLSSGAERFERVFEDALAGKRSGRRFDESDRDFSQSAKTEERRAA